MKHTASALALLIALLACPCGMPAAEPAVPRAKQVFIVSIDQGNADLIDQLDLPTIDRLAAEGAHAAEAFTIVPSVTLPSHASMVTGVGIQKHQVTWNGYEPDRGPVKVPTIFTLAKAQGLTTAMYVAKEKLKQLDQPGSLDAFVRPHPRDDARAVANAFAEQVATLKPNLCLIHFRDPDSEGHRHGAYSPEKIQALKDCDAALGVILQAITDAGLMDTSVVIVTADHGGHDTRNADGEMVGTHGGPQSEDVLIPWIIWGNGVREQATLERTVLQYDTAATALWLLDVPVPDHFWGRPVKEAFE